MAAALQGYLSGGSSSPRERLAQLLKLVAVTEAQLRRSAAARAAALVVSTAAGDGPHRLELKAAAATAAREAAEAAAAVASATATLATVDDALGATGKPAAASSLDGVVQELERRVSQVLSIALETQGALRDAQRRLLQAQASGKPLHPTAHTSGGLQAPSLDATLRASFDSSTHSHAVALDTFSPSSSGVQAPANAGTTASTATKTSYSSTSFRDLYYTPPHIFTPLAPTVGPAARQPADRAYATTASFDFLAPGTPPTRSVSAVESITPTYRPAGSYGANHLAASTSYLSTHSASLSSRVPATRGTHFAHVTGHDTATPYTHPVSRYQGTTVWPHH